MGQICYIAVYDIIFSHDIIVLTVGACTRSSFLILLKKLSGSVEEGSPS